MPKARRRFGLDQLHAFKQAMACSRREMREVLRWSIGARRRAAGGHAGPLRSEAISTSVGGRVLRRGRAARVQAGQQVVAGAGRAGGAARTGRRRPARRAGSSTASACGHGWSQASQVHVASSSPPYGSSSTPASSACSTRSCGRSPASSAADPAGLGGDQLDQSAATAPRSSTGTATATVRARAVLDDDRPADRPRSTVMPPTAPARARARAAAQVAPRRTPPPRPRAARPCPTTCAARAAPRRGAMRGWMALTRRPRRPVVLRAQGDQVAQLGVAELGQRRLAAAEHGVGEGALAGEQLGDLLLDGAARDQPVHLHRPGLADPVGAVGGLLLDRGVPPAVEVDDVVGAGEVEPGAAGLEREQEDRRPSPCLEAAHHRLALADRGAAVQELVGHAGARRGAPRAAGPSRRTG